MPTHTYPLASSVVEPEPVTCAVPLHVAHVVLSLDVGGLERNVINQVREGVSLGQSVSVICLQGPGVLASKVEALGGRWFCLHKMPGIKLSLISRMRRLLQSLRPHIIHTHQFPTLFYSGPATHGLGKTRIVHTEHGLEPFQTRSSTRWLGRLGGLYADRFFCLTEEMADLIVRHRIVSRQKVRIIRNGIEIAPYRECGQVDELRRTLGIPTDSPVIGTVGRLVDVKNHEMLIRAFHQIRHTHPAAHLLVVGDGPLKSFLQQQVRDLGLEKFIHLVGYQPNVWHYLHAMNVFALTSRSEGTPQAVLEASIAGLPVVASRVGGLPDVIDDGQTGFLFSPDAQDTLVHYLLTLIGNRGLSHRLGEAASRRVESLYSIQRMAADYHDHYLDLLSHVS